MSQVIGTVIGIGLLGLAVWAQAQGLTVRRYPRSPERREDDR